MKHKSSIYRLAIYLFVTLIACILYGEYGSNSNKIRLNLTQFVLHRCNRAVDNGQSLAELEDRLMKSEVKISQFGELTVGPEQTWYQASSEEITGHLTLGQSFLLIEVGVSNRNRQIVAYRLRWIPITF